MATRAPKARLFNVTSKLPFVGETADPWIFIVLSALCLVTLLGLAFPRTVFPGDRDARSHVLQVAAGMLVVLGAYFTAVNIREIRAQQAFERLRMVIDQLGSPKEAVRLGALCLLESIALEKLDLPSGSTGEGAQARRRAITEALASVAAEPGGLPPALLAREILARLGPSGSSGITPPA